MIANTFKPYWITGIPVQKCMRIEAIPVRSAKNNSKPKATAVVFSGKAAATTRYPNANSSVILILPKYGRG